MEKDKSAKHIEHERQDWIFDRNANLGHEQGAYYRTDIEGNKIAAILPDDKSVAIDKGGNARLLLCDGKGEWQDLGRNCSLDEAMDIGNAAIGHYRSADSREFLERGGEIHKEDLEKFREEAREVSLEAAEKENKELNSQIERDDDRDR